MELNTASEMDCGLNGGGDHSTSGANITTGVWHHLVCVFDNNANRTILYIDNSEELNEAENGTPAALADSLYIGSAGGVQFVNGTVDDVRIYNRPLSPAEVKQLYQLGTVRITQ